jgi:hypothetical protein
MILPAGNASACSPVLFHSLKVLNEGRLENLFFSYCVKCYWVRAPCRAEPAGETRDYASSLVNDEGTFRAGRVSLNVDRWESVELSHISPRERLFAAVPGPPPVAARNSRT